MPGLLLTIFLLSLLSAVSSTSEYPKSLEGWYPSSQRMRDRRTSHWDLRSNSNLYDDDRRRGGGVVNDDRENGEISYPFNVDQRSSLGFPALSLVDSTRKSSNKIDYQDKDRIDSDSRSDHCIAVVEKPFYIGSIKGSRQQLDDANNNQLNTENSDRFETIRCRRTPQGWLLQRPVYVEEPSWISIDLNRQNRAGNSLSNEDPFYVARGKRSLQFSANYRQSRIKKDLTINDEISDKKYIKNINQRTVSRRRKRDALSDILGSSVIEGHPMSGIEGLSVDGGIKAQSYVGPRNKHSDLLDILNEPFFISRGKKDISTSTGQLDWYKKYSKNRLQDYNYLVMDENGNNDNIRNCDPILNDCLVEFEIDKNRKIDPRWIVDNPLAIRYRRGFMEDLLKEADPFYLARG